MARHDDNDDLAAHQDIDAYLANLPWGGRTPYTFRMEVRGHVFSFAAWLQTPAGARVLAMLNRKAVVNQGQIGGKSVG